MTIVDPLKDLHLLPKTRDSWSYLYVEHASIEQENRAIAAVDALGRTPIPCATLSVLLLGPGTTITHAAIRALADSGCLVIWTGEQGVRFYAQGMGETRSSRHLLRQAALVSNPSLRMQVVRRMYAIRFPAPPDADLTLRQIRGMEGIRVREAYAAASRAFGVPWHGRQYKRSTWTSADPVNRALSAANSALYGVVHAAIVSAGFSPALGFIHTGKMLSFVYDIADLYKAELTIPAAFEAVAVGLSDLERRVRTGCRDYFRAGRLLDRIVPDIERVLAVAAGDEAGELPFDEDVAYPALLWDPSGALIGGGTNYADLNEAAES